MTATPKNKRTPPVNQFEDYILTYEVGPNAGLYPVANSAMSYVQGAYGTIGEPSTDDSYELLNIGFVFKFDQKEYKNIVISTNGWVILIDDSRTVSNALDDIFDPNFAVYSDSIKDSFGTYKHVLLCPWFDDMRNVARVPTDSNVSGYLSFLGIGAQNILTGKSKYPPGVDSSLGGIKYYRDKSSRMGNCLVVRWKSFARYTGFYNVINFDVAIYESGDIEFRYSPRINLKIDPNENATIGIFVNGESTSQPRYRDMSSFVGANDVRGNYENGGSIYDGSYTDPTRGSKYNSSLNTNSNWPGLGQFGAIFKLSPPSLKQRQLRSISSLRDAVPFISSPTAFDDRNTIPFTTQVVEYPSMLPVNFKVDNESSQPESIKRLFQSGSIRVARVVRPGLYDAVLNDSIIETRMKS